MKVTKQEIKERNIREYYILIDGLNNDWIARFTDLKDVKKLAREYDEECDGEWEPILVKFNKDTKKSVYIEDWSY